MKTLLAILLVFCSSLSIATVASAQTLKVSDAEATVLLTTINGYFETKNNQLEIFDRETGKLVTVGKRRIITDDPKCVIFVSEDKGNEKIAVCVECVDVSVTTDEEGVDHVQEGSDQYVVWFLLKRAGAVGSHVLDTTVKSKNGKELTEWAQSGGPEMRLVHFGTEATPEAPAAPEASAEPSEPAEPAQPAAQ